MTTPDDHDETASTQQAPHVSVVVPTYDRPRNLAACLGALSDVVAPPGGFEVVVVDDGGEVPLDRVVEPFTDRLDVRLVRQGNAGPAAARNRGAAEARGQVLAFTDDDCRPAPEWLDALVAAHDEHPDALVGGRTINALADDPFAAASETVVEHVTRWTLDTDAIPFVASNNLTADTAAFHDLGGFDTSFPIAAGEDRDLCARWFASGRPVLQAPGAVVGHAHAMTLRQFLRQHRNYGRGARLFAAARQSRGEDAGLLRGVRFWGGLARHAGRQGPANLVLVGLSQVATAVGFFTSSEPEAARAGTVDVGGET